NIPLATVLYELIQLSTPEKSKDLPSIVENLERTLWQMEKVISIKQNVKLKERIKGKELIRPHSPKVIRSKTKEDPVLNANKTWFCILNLLCLMFSGLVMAENGTKYQTVQRKSCMFSPTWKNYA
ncbi:hypothetical protein LOAG_16117, partial [Loa loa]